MTRERGIWKGRSWQSDLHYGAFSYLLIFLGVVLVDLVNLLQFSRHDNISQSCRQLNVHCPMWLINIKHLWSRPVTVPRTGFLLLIIYNETLRHVCKRRGQSRKKSVIDWLVGRLAGWQVGRLVVWILSFCRGQRGESQFAVDGLRWRPGSHDFNISGLR